MERHNALTDDNFILYCAKYYDNPNCRDSKEFFQDLKHIKYVKKLLTRYEKNNELNERLILNHIIILNNLFSPEHTVRILFLKVPEEQYPFLKPFLVFLDLLPDKVYNIRENGKTYLTDIIPMDSTIVKALRKI